MFEQLRSLILKLLAYGIVCFLSGHALAFDRYKIDPEHTYSTFEYNHWGLSLQRGRSIAIAVPSILILRIGPVVSSSKSMPVLSVQEVPCLTLLCVHHGSLTPQAIRRLVLNRQR